MLSHDCVGVSYSAAAVSTASVFSPKKGCTCLSGKQNTTLGHDARVPWLATIHTTQMASGLYLPRTLISVCEHSLVRYSFMGLLRVIYLCRAHLLVYVRTYACSVPINNLNTINLQQGVFKSVFNAHISTLIASPGPVCHTSLSRRRTGARHTERQANVYNF